MPRPAWNRLAWVAVFLVAAAMRLSTWRQVFTADGVRFAGDDDTYYHALRAQRIAQDYPHVPWDDPRIDYPDGAAILWPPLFDHIIATAAFAVAGGPPPAATTERVAAVTPPILGLATLPLVAALGRILCGPGAGLPVAFFVAVLPAHAEMSVLGRPDQHVTEVLFCCAVLLAFVRGWHGRGMGDWQAAAWLGLAIALSFWNWMGSALNLCLLVLFAALRHILGPPEDPAAARVPLCLALGAAAAAILLAGSVLAFGAPGALASASLSGVGGLHVALVTLTAGFAAVLWMASRRRGSGRVRRAVEVLAAAVVPAACAAILLPGLREGVAHGLTALARGNPWYRNIQEFDPLLCAGFEPLSAELRNAMRWFGLLPLLMPLAIPAMRRAWRDRPAERPTVLFLALWGLAFLVLAFARVRFAIYFVVPLALWSWLALTQLSASLASRLRREKLRPVLHHVLFWLAAGLALAPALRDVVSRPLAAMGEEHGELVRTLQWLREQPPALPGRPAVLAEWSYGHLVEYFADKPVVVDPFGSDLGPNGMRDSAAFFLAADPRAAEAVLERRRVGFVVLANPLTEAYFARGFAPPDAPPAVVVRSHCLTGVSAEPTDAFWKLVPVRLYFFDGAGDPGLEGYRLLDESDGTAVWKGIRTARFKIFGVVPGATVTIRGEPGRTVEARTRLRTRSGRVFEWRRKAVPDAAGAAVLRPPYATGTNGMVTAEAYRVSDGVRTHLISLTADQVERGAELEVDLGGPESGGPDARVGAVDCGRPNDRLRSPA